MSGRYATHAQMKDSGIWWLGAIPAHWEVIQSRRLFEQRKERMRSGDEQLTSSQKYGVIPQSEFMRLEGQNVMQVFTGAEILKHVEPDDFVISMRSFQGGLEWCAYAGCVSSAYVGLIPIKNVVPAFFKYLFKSKPYIQALQSTSNLVRDGQALRYQNFIQVSLPLISEEEQTQIAKFLDYETAKIDALIAKQQQLIALLQEKRQAVISHAVTKGLNPAAPLRDSGVAWLGAVPAHWTVSKIKHVSDLESGHTPSRKVDEYWVDCQIPWVSLNDTRQLKVVDYISDTAVYINEKGMANSSAHELPAGCVIFTRDATIGLAAITTRRMAVSQHIIAWVCDPTKVSSEYLLLVFYAMEAELERFTSGATLKTIGMPDVNRLTGAFPVLEEQAQIVKHVFSLKEKLTASIAESESMLEILAERRTALISAAVTGKIDVRGWQPPQAQPAGATP